MKFVIFVILLIFAAAVLGQDVPTNRQSCLYIPASDLGGVWYLLYWGVPQSQSLYPKNMKCLISWAHYSNNSYVDCHDVAILNDETQENKSFDVKIDSLPNGKYSYTFLTSCSSEIQVKWLAHNKYKYTAGIMYYGEKKYLFVYGRNPNILNECGTKAKLKEWEAKTDNVDTPPSYKINPRKCKCAEVKNN